MKKKVWGIIYLYLLVMQLGCEAMPAAVIWKMNMLPDVALYIFLGILVLLVAVPAVLFYVGIKKASKAFYYIRRILATFLTLVFMGGSVFGFLALSKVNETVETVTEVPAVSSTIAVYVLSEDPAETIADAADYSYEKLENYDVENTENVISAIESEVGNSILVTDCDSISTMAGDLLNGTVDALILNEAYADILEDDDTYSNFSAETKMIYEYSVDQTTQWEITSEVEDVSNEAFIVYLSGSDTRSKMLETSRSDVNILAVVNPETEQILLINTPRDYYVENPSGNNALDKLTHCGIYGIDCSIQALSQLYSTDIDYYAQINFTGFETIVDAVGGVTVYSDVAFSTKKYDFVEGYNDLDGAEALAFARERHALADGDNDRGKNQMKIITAVVESLNASNVLNNYDEILDSIQGMFVTDMSSDEIMSLVNLQISRQIDWEVYSYAVSGTGGSATTYSMPGSYVYVTYPDQSTVDHASELIQEVLEGESISQSDVEDPEEETETESSTESSTEDETTSYE